MFTNLTPEILRELLALSEKKETLLAQISEIDTKISAAAEGKVTPAASKPKPRVQGTVKEKTPPKASTGKTSTPRGNRGSLKEAILDALKAKPLGISVPELAKITGSTVPSLHTFFATTGKKIPGVTKVDRGVWTYNTTTTPAITPAPAAMPGTSSTTALPLATDSVTTPEPAAPTP